MRTRESARGSRLSILAFAAALVAASCGSDRDGQNDGTKPPTESPPYVSSLITLTTDRDHVPADGAALTTAIATLTDARGNPIADAPIEFTADLGDITWAWIDPDDPANLFPTRCVASTGTDGVAECVFRAGFTPGTTYVRAATSSPFPASASTQIVLG